MNPENKTEVPTPGLTEIERGLELLEKDRRREERWTAFCWLAGIALAALLLLVLHPFLSADHFMFFVILSPIWAFILGRAVWAFPETARQWPAYRANALSERIRDDQYQCRRLTRLLVALSYHAPIPACEIEAAWQALTYARDIRNGSRHVHTHEDGLRIERAEAMYRVWKAEYERTAPERAMAEAQEEMERAIARSADWRAEQD